MSDHRASNERTYRDCGQLLPVGITLVLQNSNRRPARDNLSSPEGGAASNWSTLPPMPTPRPYLSRLLRNNRYDANEHASLAKFVL
jgi:hypothetical protein